MMPNHSSPIQHKCRRSQTWWRVRFFIEAATNRQHSSRNFQNHSHITWFQCTGEMADIQKFGNAIDVSVHCVIGKNHFISCQFMNLHQRRLNQLHQTSLTCRVYGVGRRYARHQAAVTRPQETQNHSALAPRGCRRLCSGQRRLQPSLRICCLE